MNFHRPVLAASVLATTLVALPTTGLAAVDPYPNGCVSCHVLDNPRGSPPIIDGQHAEFLAVQLRAFRDSHRDAFPMGMLSEGLDEARIQALSGLLAARPWPVRRRSRGSPWRPRR